MFVKNKISITFADVNKTKNDNHMLTNAFYFYGFYFYFAEQAERDVACQHQ